MLYSPASNNDPGLDSTLREGWLSQHTSPVIGEQTLQMRLKYSVREFFLYRDASTGEAWVNTPALSMFDGFRRATKTRGIAPVLWTGGDPIKMYCPSKPVALAYSEALSGIPGCVFAYPVGKDATSRVFGAGFVGDHVVREDSCESVSLSTKPRWAVMRLVALGFSEEASRREIDEIIQKTTELTGKVQWKL